MKTRRFLRFLQGRGLWLLLAIIWAIISFTPFFFMVMSTLKQKQEFFKFGAFALPQSITLANYQTVLTSSYLTFLRNSVVVVLSSLTVLLTCSSMAAFVFSRIPLRTNRLLYSFVIACMAIPIHVAFIPVFLLTKRAGIYDTLWALIGPYVTFNIPVSVFILTGFMMGIPHEIEEAAEIDGCGYLGKFSRVAIPLSLPALVTIAIYNGINMWNEFSFALILTQSVHSRTLPMATWQFRGEYASDTPMIMTVLVLATLPMILIYLLGQDRILEGMMAGAVKG